MVNILLLGSNGYIGSRVFEYLNSVCPADNIVGIDIDWDEKSIIPPVNQIDYRKLNSNHSLFYDIVINLCGHSSVNACEDQPRISLFNNCIDFFHFTHKLKPNTKIIYASSASVYGGSFGNYECRETFNLLPPIKEYDRQKQLLDYYMIDSGLDYYGLRFGTVNGYSKNPRNRLMINSMVKSAKTKNLINVTNGDSYRAILGLNDLCRAIHAIINEEYSSPGFYNLASFNMKIKDIGKNVADLLKCNYKESGGEDTYSFCLSTNKFEKEFNFEFKDTLESIVIEASNNDFSLDRY